eukprot:5766719-Amphidinium_carterae.1
MSRTLLRPKNNKRARKVVVERGDMSERLTTLCSESCVARYGTGTCARRGFEHILEFVLAVKDQEPRKHMNIDYYTNR